VPTRTATSAFTPLKKRKPESNVRQKPENSVARVDVESRFVEHFALVFSLLFVGSIGFLIWYTDGKIINSTVRVLQSFESSDAQASRLSAVNCQDPRNKNTPYCVERAANIESEWNALGHSRSGPGSMFSLHGRSK